MQNFLFFKAVFLPEESILVSDGTIDIERGDSKLSENVSEIILRSSQKIWRSAKHRRFSAKSTISYNFEISKEEIYKIFIDHGYVSLNLLLCYRLEIKFLFSVYHVSRDIEYRKNRPK